MKKISFALMLVALFTNATFSYSSNYGGPVDFPWTLLRIIEVDNFCAEGSWPARIEFVFENPNTDSVVYRGYIAKGTDDEMLASLLTAYANDFRVAIEYANDNGTLAGAKLRIKK